MGVSRGGVPTSGVHAQRLECALVVAAGLERMHSVASWRKALDWSRYRLNEACVKGSGLPPKGVLLALVAAIRHDPRADGWRLQKLAERLGYRGGEAALSHAVRRAPPCDASFLKHARDLWFQQHGGGVGPHGNEPEGGHSRR